MPETTGKNRIAFRLAPGMQFGTRMTLIAALVTVGSIIQLLFGIAWGWPLVLLGALLGIIKGLDTRPEVSSREEWQSTTIEELEDVETLAQKISDWRGRTDRFRATSGAGCGMLALALAVLVISAFLIWAVVDSGAAGSPVRGRHVTPIWVLDFLTMLIPIWFAGWARAWEPPQLPRKAGYLLGIYRAFSTEPDLEFLPSLLVSRQGEIEVPKDCRLLVKIRSAPPEFIGIQMQVSMNDVQGTKYPYCYSVIIAKPEFGLDRRAAAHLTAPDDGGFLGLGKLFKDSNARKEMAFSRFGESLVEVSSESDVDVLVVRQETSGKGYHTTEDQARIVFNDALSLTRLVLRSPG